MWNIVDFHGFSLKIGNFYIFFDHWISYIILSWSNRIGMFGKTTLKEDFWLHPNQLSVILELGSDTSSRKWAPELFRLLRSEKIVELPSLLKNKPTWCSDSSYPHALKGSVELQRSVDQAIRRRKRWWNRFIHGSGLMDFIINLPHLTVGILSWLEMTGSVIISHFFFH